MELTETKLSGRTVYHGRIVDIHMDEVRLPNGKTSQREIVEHPGGVVILPLDERMRVVTVTQYRYAMGMAMTELPAGKLEPGERSDQPLRHCGNCMRKSVPCRAPCPAGRAAFFSRYFYRNTVSLSCPGSDF